ncbi:uncharacterized protein ACA1_336920 [Acanthamoeba castellanii str. Neff]|uniref:Uncharacterized protein n=1 Tax=Acanthamoeba castellanii (strain ATCC 30010 / Neff) TaxID=1257118 RepID=L8GSQ8_ACACF|nr:uncharacterized protein ACA1_336920 [Acanthamoeba castellanii str. Neff]ELR16239.1 hypothetical protein ACA1_336920 [Acanthamoeba castellanii str. Neff]
MKKTVRVLVVDKGFGRGRALVQALGEGWEVAVVVVPEPADALEAGVADLRPALASRGGKLAAAVLRRGLWKGPTLLVSAMSTTECCSVQGVPIVLAHGTRDGTNPIHRVRDDVQLGTKGLLVLHEFDDDHHLGSIELGDTFRQLLEEVYALQFKVAECVAADDRAGTKESSAGGGRMALFEQITARRKNNC